MASASRALEAILLERCWISQGELQRARQYRGPAQSLAGSLIEIRVIEPRRLVRALAEAYGLPFQTSLDDDVLDGTLLTRIGVDYARKNRVLPLGTDGTSVVIAAADPSKYEPLDDLAVLFGMPVQLLLVPFDILDRAIQYAGQRTTAAVAGFIINLEEQRLEIAASQLNEAHFDLLGDDTLALSSLVSAILWRAVEERAKEILIEPGEKEVLVRFQTDENPYDVVSFPRCFGEALSSRLKRMAGLSTNDQSGRIRLRFAGRVAVLRMRTAPGLFGERIVLRFPNRDHEYIDIIEECEDALRQLTGGVTNIAALLFCRGCKAPLLVKNARFCKDCGAKLTDTALSRAQTRLAPYDAEAGIDCHSIVAA